MNIRKMKKDELLNLVISLNEIIKDYKKVELITKFNTRQKLQTLAHEYLSYIHNNNKMKEYVIKDIQENIYKLHGNDIEFEWHTTVMKTPYIGATCLVPTKITHNSSYHIRDNMLWKSNELKEFFQNTITSKRQQTRVSLKSLDSNELDKFYCKFVEMSGIESIFSKINGVIKRFSNIS